MKIGILGLGLIGGSLARAMRAHGHAVVGHDASPAHLRTALEIGLIEAALPPAAIAAGCELIAVAVPVNQAAGVCAELLGYPGQATVFDLGSTKGVLAKALCGHPERARLVLSHPMAGTEFSGPTAALEGLFTDKTAVLCDVEQSGAAHLARVRQVYGELSMRTVEQGSAEHDLHVAYVSHISHVSSFALSLTVLAKERDESQIFNLASGGFASTVRLAKSNADTWAPIFEHNRDHLLDVLDEYINVLAEFRTALIKRNFTHVHTLIDRANAIGPMLPQNLSP